MKSYAKLQTEAREMLNWCEENSHWDWHENIIAVNVKRHNDYVDVERLIEEYVQKNEYSEELRSFLTERFTDQAIENLWEFWIEHECEDIIFDYWYCVFSSQKWYDHERQILQFGIKPSTGINNLKTLEKYARNDARAKDNIRILEAYNRRQNWNSPLYGQFGRSGGWIGIVKTRDLTSQLEEFLDKISDPHYRHSQGQNLKYWNQEFMNIKEEINAVKWAFSEIDTFNKGLLFEDELRSRFDETEMELENLRSLDFEVAI